MTSVTQETVGHYKLSFVLWAENYLKTGPTVKGIKSQQHTEWEDVIALKLVQMIFYTYY